MDTFFPVQLFSCFGYVGKVKKCLRKVQNPPHEFAALKDLSVYGVSFAMRAGYYLFDYIIVPVPGENNFIAKEIARNLGLYVEVSGLRKVSNSTSFPFFANLRGVCNKKVLLVDTVCITGKTLLAAAKALYAAGAVEVRCFTLARVI
jgi:uracil phosphoribosyltransferase